MFLVLLTFIVRPAGFTFRIKVSDPRWRNVWDWTLCTGGTGAALLFGVAFGNLFLGIPFHYDELQRPVYTASFFNLLHPFALLSGIVSLSVIVMHGATYASLKVEDPIESRAAKVGRLATLAYIVAFSVGGACVATLLDGQAIVGAAHSSAPSDPLLKIVEVIRGGWLHNFQNYPLLWLAPASALLSAVCNWILLGTARKGRALVRREDRLTPRQLQGETLAMYRAADSRALRSG